MLMLPSISALSLCGSGQRLDHYKHEHHELLQETTTVLELALWKTNLDDKEGGEILGNGGVRTAMGSRQRARVTSGASVVIKNVLTFLYLS